MKHLLICSAILCGLLHFQWRMFRRSIQIMSMQNICGCIKFCQRWVEVWISVFFPFCFPILVDEGVRIQMSIKWVIISPPEKWHLNGVSLAGRWWPNIECWLGSFVIFQGTRTSIVKKLYIVCVFFRGVQTPCPPLDPRMGNRPNWHLTLKSHNNIMTWNGQ